MNPFNPQKWLYVARTCAVLLLRDLSTLEASFAMQAPYMGRDEEIPNLGELSVQGTRATEVLKLWLTLRHLGTIGCATLVDEGVRLAQYFSAGVKAREFLARTGAEDTNIVCFRGEPAELPHAQWDGWNAALQAHLRDHADFFLSLPSYQGDLWLRAVLLNPFTDTGVVDNLLERIDRFRECYPDG